MLEVLEATLCHHCGEDCPDNHHLIDDKAFCCIGCKTVFELLSDKSLCTYYDLNEHAGVSLKSQSFKGKFDYLSNLEIENDLLDFKSNTLNKVTLYIPSVHCTSCVWLLENFNKIKKGVKYGRLNFTKKELSLAYNPKEVTLKEIVSLLATLGYEPLISLESSDKAKKIISAPSNRLIKQIAVTGFCAGNIMLLSFPEYFKFDLQNSVDAQYQSFFLYLNVLLSLPVFFFGGFDYLKGAYISIRELLNRNSNILSVDIPIALGISALFVRSLYETLVNHGGAYWDSLAGLTFFLLVGKWVQAKTFESLSFERNYRSYFPLAVKIKSKKSNNYRNVEQLHTGDIMQIHHEELIPADAILQQGRAEIDYSFVTGESQPIRIKKGDLIYAGGRQKGEMIELQVKKEVSKSYLTQLWNNSTFDKEKKESHTKLADNFSKYFTYITLSIAFGTAIYWQFTDPSLVWPAFTAVLMVACPCALTLSMPFTMGTVMSIFGRNKLYVRNPNVIQFLADVKQLVFDKTGTLTKTSTGQVEFIGSPLSEKEEELLKSITSSSTHPLSKLISESLSTINYQAADYFFEHKGAGMEGILGKHNLRIGNADFLDIAKRNQFNDAAVYIEINQKIRGYYKVKSSFRKGFQSVLETLSKRFKIHLISGDQPREKNDLNAFFKEESLHFNLKPQAKLEFIEKLQKSDDKILMLGDGLNDAGALGQSDVGIAITEDAQAFTPASDAILDASKFDKLPLFLRFSRTSIGIVKVSFLLSLVYNFVCVGWAVSGQLSPVLAAIFMPLSSITVVLFAVAITYIYAYKFKLI